MHILLFGISNIGKTTVGGLLAERLGFRFFDLDEEVKKKYRITLDEFVSRGTLQERDMARCRILRRIISRTGVDTVVSVSPLSYVSGIRTLLRSTDVLPIELVDSAEKIFDRIIFSDENDETYRDDEYKNAHRQEYLEDIMEDQTYYGAIYSPLCKRFDMGGDDAATCAERLASVVEEEFRLRSASGR